MGEHTHELKTWPEYFQAVWDGNKTFELRKNDRDYQVGDKLILREWCPELNDYTGRKTTNFVSYILKDAEEFKYDDGATVTGPAKLELGLKDGYVVMGFEQTWAF